MLEGDVPARRRGSISVIASDQRERRSLSGASPEQTRQSAEEARALRTSFGKPWRRLREERESLRVAANPRWRRRPTRHGTQRLTPCKHRRQRGSDARADEVVKEMRQSHRDLQAHRKGFDGTHSRSGHDWSHARRDRTEPLRAAHAARSRVPFLADLSQLGWRSTARHPVRRLLGLMPDVPARRKSGSNSRKFGSPDQSSVTPQC